MTLEQTFFAFFLLITFWKWNKDKPASIPDDPGGTYGS